MTNKQIIAALEEYDAAMLNQTNARNRVRKAEDSLKRSVGARLDHYMDGNELVAALGRKLAENLKGQSSTPIASSAYMEEREAST
jgi:hypothetical protein